MSNDRFDVLDRLAPLFEAPEPSFEAFLRRRDRKRRNQRIAAGVVGIGIFVAAVWIVTSGLSLDRSAPSVVPGGDVTGPAETGLRETGPAETAPPPSLVAFGAPDVVKQGMCSDDARWRLELTDLGDWSKVRFEVHRSPVGDEWHILLRPFTGFLVMEPFGGRRVVASDSGIFVVQRLYQVWAEGLKAKAVDRQTGQVCKASAWNG
jgi:hypothetical protein